MDAWMMPNPASSATTDSIGVHHELVSRLPAFRRHVTVARSLAVAALCVASSAKAQSPLLWGGLKTGPHAVGFRLQYKLDQSREYDPEFVTDTTRFPVHRPRPIMIGIWYPAEKTNANRMTYRQYLDISPGPGPLAPFASRLESALRRVVGQETTGHQPGAMTPAETRAFEQLLATKTVAVKDAPAASGRFPVILYHPGTAGSYEDNSALFEYLASRGYIVVSSPYPDPNAYSVFITGDMAGSFADLDFLATFARALPNADADRLGVMGHSYGAWASFAWTANVDSPVRALITLDSGFEYDSLSAGPELLQLHMKRNRNNIRAATLRVASTERHPHFEYLDPYLKFVPRYEASITSLAHDDYLTHGAIGPDLMPEKWPDARKDRRTSYDRLAEVIVNFLDASLKQRPEARAFLSQRVERSASDSRLNLQFKAAAPVPPTQRQMAQYLRRYGAEKAIAMLRAFPDVAESKLLGGIIALSDDDDIKTALPSLLLAEKTYPKNAGIETMLGEVLARTGDKAGAEKAYRKALVLLPDDDSGFPGSYWKSHIERGLKELGVQ
jgi:predicted dienelactone hydrolase